MKQTVTISIFMFWISLCVFVCFSLIFILLKLGYFIIYYMCIVEIILNKLSDNHFLPRECFISSKEHSFVKYNKQSGHEAIANNHPRPSPPPDTHSMSYKHHGALC